MNENRIIENIPIEKIIPNIYQPRIMFDDKSIEELSKSIKNHGIIQPLILRKIGEKYEIIDGERRYKAAKKINIKRLPSIILDLEDKEAAELILMENMQKQLLTPIEEANAYQQIMFLNKFNIEELSTKLGKDKSTIENKLKLLTLHPIIQEALLNNKISEGHAKALTKVENKKAQEKLFNKVINERITVKALEEIINKKENNKTEVEFMDNSQLNFNQYNNLLKEQEKPQMEATITPSPILESSPTEQKTNEFFPSLEEQPLNAEVPISFEENIPAMEMPQFVTSENSITTPEVPTMQAQEPALVQNMEMPQVQNTVQIPEQIIEQPVAEVPQNNVPFEMPAFEVPTMQVQEPPLVQNIEAPAMEMSQEQPVEQPLAKDVTPAINIIKNLKPLLENSGYNITFEEADTPNEYQIIIKLQK